MDVLESVVALGPTAIHVALLVLVFAESAAWLGVLVPGDLALLTAGALTATGEVELLTVVAVAFVGTVAGYAAAYELGRAAGPRLHAWAATRPRFARDLPVVDRLVRERGDLLVVTSRWVGALCAVVPLVAGAAGVPRRRFLATQVVGAVTWVVPVVLLGRLAGDAANADRWLLWASLGIAALLTIATWVAWRRLAGRPVPTAALWGGAGIVLGGVTATVLVRVAGTDRVTAVLSQVDGRALLGVGVLEVAALLALVQLYRTTFHANGGRIRFRDAMTVTLGAFSLTQLLPGGGAAGGVFAMRRFRRHGADPVRATTTVLLVGLVSMGTLGVVLSTATMIAALASRQYAAYAVASSTATVLVLSALWRLRRLTEDGPARDRLVGRLGRLTWRGRPVAREWASSLAAHEGLLHRPAVLLRPAGWSALNWVFDVGVLALLLHAVGADAPLVTVLVAFAVANLLNALPLTPGGIGIVEAGLAATLVGLGADAAATSVAVLGYRAIAYWLPTAVAAPVVVTGLRAPIAAPAVEAAR